MRLQTRSVRSVKLNREDPKPAFCQVLQRKNANREIRLISVISQEAN
jgi:hypothetical protein